MSENQNPVVVHKSVYLCDSSSVKVIVQGGLLAFSWILLFLFMMFGNPTPQLQIVLLLGVFTANLFIMMM